MNFKYKLKGTGWAEGRLEIGSKLLEFEVSYLCDPLADLLEALITINPDIPAIGYAKEVTFVWQSEPWGYKWVLSFVSFDVLQIKVFNIDDVFENEEKGTLCFDVTTDYYEFVKLVTDELTLLVKHYGFVQYYQQWAGNTNFPLAEFLMLKKIVLKKSGEVVCTNDQNQEIFRTNLKKEIELLIK
jgi:hypothetical protein